MQVAVTGATGFLGAAVVRSLVQQGHAVAGLTRSGDASRLVDVPWQPVRGDLADADARRRLLTGSDALIHLAWFTTPGAYRHGRENLDALAWTTALFAEAVDHGVGRVVGVGTCLEYAGTEQTRRVGSPLAPDSLYASCKHAAATVGAAIAKAADVSFAWARVFHVYGPGEGPRWLVPQVLAAVRDGRRFELSPGDQQRDFLHTADVGSAIATGAMSDHRGAFNVCSGEAISLRRFLEPLGPELVFGARPYGPAEAMRIAGAPATLHALGWRPRFDPASGLEHTRQAFMEGRPW